MNLEENEKLYQVSQMIIENSSRMTQIDFLSSGRPILFYINFCRRHVEDEAEIIFKELSLQMFQYLNESDLYLSYSVKELLVQIYEVFQYPGYDELLQLYLKCVTQEVAVLFTSLNVFHDHKLLHLLDLLEAIIIKNAKYSNDGVLQLMTFVFDNWKLLYDIVFSKIQTDNKATFFQNLLHSTMKLYVKMIKSKSKYNLNYQHMVDLAEFLVAKLKLKTIPQTCIPKVLEYLFHCCPEFEEVTSPSISLENMRCQKLVLRILSAVTSGLNADKMGESVSIASQFTYNQHWIYHAIGRSFPHYVFIGHGNFTIIVDEQRHHCLHPKVLHLPSLQKLLIFVTKCQSFITTCKQKSSRMKEEISKYEDDKTTFSEKNPEVEIVYNLMNFFHRGEDGVDVHKKLMNVFHQQDDAMIRFLLYVLQITVTSQKVSTEKEESCIKPNILFLELLSLISWDHSVLVDWLISPETLFLSFLIKQLKFIISNPSQWKKDCQKFDTGRKTSQSQMKGEELSSILSNKFDTSCHVSREKLVNLTAYSDSEEEDDDDSENIKLSDNSQIILTNLPDVISFVPDLSKTSFVTNKCFNTNNTMYGRKLPKLNHMSSKEFCMVQTDSMTTSSSSFSIASCTSSSLSHEKTSDTFKKLAELIEKLRAIGSFPYNPRPLLKLLIRFHVENKA